jgi:hypothetical protein
MNHVHASAAWMMPVLFVASMGAQAHSPDMASLARGADGADAGSIVFQGAVAGVTPFIALASFTGSGLTDVTSVTYDIAQPAKATAKPVHVEYAMSYLQVHGDAPPGGPMRVPVVGLYAGAKNPVSVTFAFQHGKSQTIQFSLDTAAYDDPTGIYASPKILTPRTSAFLPFSYLYIKSGLESPVIIDTDGEVRWVGAPFSNSVSSTFDNGVFLIGSHDANTVSDMQLDGTFITYTVDDPAVLWFNHNIVAGRDAYLTGVDRMVDDVEAIQSTVAEMTLEGHVIREWDFARIIGDYMASMGDNPALFVLPGQNWLHINSSYYDPNDNALVISSRQEFIMKVDYDTGAIKWIFGDPTKYWYTFASLRAKAISLVGSHFYPIGQHGINMQSDGSLWMMNNGSPTAADGVPPGAPLGASRLFSASSAYTLNPVDGTANEIYRYVHQYTLKSPICGSAYKEVGGAMIIDFASADDNTHTHLVALDANGNTAFEYQYHDRACSTNWHTIPIPLEAMSLQ